MHPDFVRCRIFRVNYHQCPESNYLVGLSNDNPVFYVKKRINF